jgi:hypothetical protein
VTHRLEPGQPVQLESGRPPELVVFEDDGETAYLYALDLRREDNPILDALHICNAGDVGPCRLDLAWTDDGAAVALLLDGEAYAMVDFAEPRLMCRNGFPPPGRESPVSTHAWDEHALRARFAQD